ncbi:glycosyltransferase [Trichothermofontia sp.]
MATLCLNMIVKNEAKIITRALSSVKDYIDYWVIADTGSTDSTDTIIEQFFQVHHIPGELYHHPWKDFGFNRTLALQHAKNKADYILLMDADMVLVVDDPEFKTKLVHDVYLVYQGTEFTYANPRILKGSLDAEYRGVTHEYLHVPNDHRETLTGIRFIEYCDGGNRPEKFQRDVQLLEAGLRAEPGNKRYWFYLGQSYKDLKQYDKAIHCYRKRLELGINSKEKEWSEEMYYSLYMLGYCYQGLKNWAAALAYYLEAYEYYPKRAESIYEITQYYRSLKKYKLAYKFAQWGVAIPYPQGDILFVSRDVYDYKFLYELSILFYYVGEKGEGYVLSELLIHDRDRCIHETIRFNVHANLLFYIESLENHLQAIENQQSPITFQKLTTQKVKETNKLINASILFDIAKNRYLINVREVNYTYDIERNLHIPDGDAAITHNHLLAIGADQIAHLETLYQSGSPSVSEYFIIEPQDPAIVKIYPGLVMGYEDMQLLKIQDQLWGLAAVRMTNAKNLNEMAMCRLSPHPSPPVSPPQFTENQDFAGNQARLYIDKVLILRGYEDEKHQKNWMPLIFKDELYLIYQMEPLTILKPNLETGHCDRVHESRIELNLGQYRGGSQLIEYEDGYLTLIHEMLWQNNRRYYFHRFVYLKHQRPLADCQYPQLEVAEISPLFYLKEKSVEYVCGLSMTPDRQSLLISFGVNDRDAYLATVPTRSLNQLLSLRHRMATYPIPQPSRP